MPAVMCYTGTLAIMHCLQGTDPPVRSYVSHSIDWQARYYMFCSREFVIWHK